MIEFPKIIKGDGFDLVKVEPSFDIATKLFKTIDAQREYLAQWLVWVDKYNRPEELYSYMKRAADVKNGAYYIVIDGNIVGSVGLEVLSEVHKTAEVGYWLSQEYTGRGIMTKAVNLLVNYGFDVIGFNRIVLLANTGNLPSTAVAERTGFVQESIAKNSFVIRDEIRDSFVFVKFRKGLDKGK